MRNFRNLEIWKNAITIVKEIYLIVEKLPENEKFGLRGQITRAAVSVPSNIAEGCSRNSENEYKRFLEIAIGSLFEVETQLIILVELSMINKNDLLKTLNLITIEEKQINSLITKIKNSKK